MAADIRWNEARQTTGAEYYIDIQISELQPILGELHCHESLFYLL